MWINGRDLASDSWTLVGLGDWLGGVTLERSGLAVPSVAGAVPSTAQTSGARRITMRFRRRLTVLTDRDAALLTLLDRTRGLCWVRFDDAPTRVIRGEFSKPRAVPVANVGALTEPTIEAEVTFTAYNAASYDTEPRVLVLGTSAVEVPLGDLASGGVFCWGAAWSAGVTRTLTLRDAGGVARWTGTFTTPSGESLASTEFLEVNLWRRYLTKVTGPGVRTNAYHWFASGVWPLLDPAYQSRAAARYATLEASAGTLQLTSRRAYAL